MSWSATATLPERKTGPAWTTDASAPGREHGPGWATQVERVAHFRTEGTLSAHIGTNYPYVTVVYAGSGQLSARIKPVKTMTAGFAASGQLSAEIHQIVYVPVTFSATGGLRTAVNDGLSAIVSGGVQLPDGLSGIITGGLLDGLAANVEGGPALVPITFTATGTLSATVVPVTSFPVTAGFSASGSLSATVMRQANVAASFTTAGALSATGFQKYAIGFADSFDRANGALGADWTARLRSLLISGNAASPSVTDWNVASPNTPMRGNDAEATIVLGAGVGTGRTHTFVGLGFDEAGAQGIYLYCNGDSNTYYFTHVAGGWGSGWVNTDPGVGPAPTAGTRITIRRIGNVYTGLVNGVPVNSWTDAANEIPRDAAHRLVACGAYNDGTNYRMIDSFHAGSVGVFSATGTLSATVVPTMSSVIDEFIRANSTVSAGPLWETVYNYVGVSGNAAYGVTAGQWCIAPAIPPLHGDDMESSIVLGAALGGGQHSMVEVGLNNAGEGAFLYSDPSGNYTIYSQSAFGVWGGQVAGTGPAPGAGDQLTLRRKGAVYQGLRNNTQVVTWTDAGYVPRDANHRRVGFALYQGTNVVDTFIGSSGGISDDFTRANNAASAGPLWLNRFNTMGCNTNAAYAAAGSDWCIATPRITMSADDMEASMIIGWQTGGGDNAFIGLGLNDAGQGAFLYNNGSGYYIFSQTTWFVNWLQQAVASGPTIATGDRLTIRRVGSVYTGLLNGTVVVSWTDSGGVVPRDVNHRLLEMAIYPGGRTIDGFTAKAL